MDFALEQAYSTLIRFSYTSLDRIVIRGHDRVLQTEGGFVDWCRRLNPGQAISQAWLDSVARRFHDGVKELAEQHRIEIVTVTSRAKKFEIAAQHRPKDLKFRGVYLILRSRETSPTFVSRLPKNSNNPSPFIIKRVGFFDHYYFYLIDPSWGPISIRLPSHLPFNVTVYLNGNRWLAQQALQRGLSIAAKDNSVVRCSDPQALQALSDSLDFHKIQAVCDLWAYRLLPVLSKEDRLRSFFRYRWFLSQVEMSHNMVFKRARQLTQVIERHVDLNRKHLQPRSIKTIFRGSPVGRYLEPIEVSVRHAFGALTVLSTQYGQTRVKQYNNHQQTFRTEVCILNPNELGVRKAIENTAALRQSLLRLLSQFQAAQSVVLNTTCHRGELAALAKPGKVNDVATPGIKLENERAIAVLSALPQLSHLPQGFRSQDVRPVVQAALGSDYTPSQATYDLRKLRGKGLVERQSKSRRFRATPEGLRVAVLLSKLRDNILLPLLPPLYEGNPPSGDPAAPSRLDDYYAVITRGIFQLTEYLALTPA